MINKKELLNQISGGPKLHLEIPQNTTFTVNDKTYTESTSITINPYTIVNITFTSTNANKLPLFTLFKEKEDRNWVIKSYQFRNSSISTTICMPENDVWCSTELFDKPTVYPKYGSFPIRINISFNSTVTNEYNNTLKWYYTYAGYRHWTVYDSVICGSNLNITANNTTITTADTTFTLCISKYNTSSNPTYPTLSTEDYLSDSFTFYSDAILTGNNNSYLSFCSVNSSIKSKDRFFRMSNADYYYYNGVLLDKLDNQQQLKQDIIDSKFISIYTDITYDIAFSAMSNTINCNNVLGDWYYYTTNIYEFDTSTDSILSVNRDLLVNSKDYGYTAAFYPQYLYGEIESIIRDDTYRYSAILSHVPNGIDMDSFFGGWGIIIGGDFEFRELDYYYASYNYDEDVLKLDNNRIQLNNISCESYGSNYGNDSNGFGNTIRNV